MINCIDILEFQQHKTSIKNSSYDDAQNKYMTNSNIEVINFDKVKNNYISSLKLENPPKSCDSLYFDNNRIVFIEFKNGKVELYNVRKKIYDSILLFTDLTNCNISQTRKEVEYILVYNKESNQNNRDCIHEPNKNIPASEQFQIFSDLVSKNANEDVLRFKLGDFKNYLLKNIYTYTIEEFEEKFINKLCITTCNTSIEIKKDS